MVVVAPVSVSAAMMMVVKPGARRPVVVLLDNHRSYRYWSGRVGACRRSLHGIDDAVAYALLLKHDQVLGVQRTRDAVTGDVCTNDFISKARLAQRNHVADRRRARQLAPQMLLEQSLVARFDFIDRIAHRRAGNGTKCGAQQCVFSGVAVAFTQGRSDAGARESSKQRHAVAVFVALVLIVGTLAPNQAGQDAQRDHVTYIHVSHGDYP